MIELLLFAILGTLVWLVILVRRLLIGAQLLRYSLSPMREEVFVDEQERHYCDLAGRKHPRTIVDQVLAEAWLLRSELARAVRVQARNDATGP